MMQNPKLKSNDQWSRSKIVWSKIKCSKIRWSFMMQMMQNRRLKSKDQMIKIQDRVIKDQMIMIMRPPHACSVEVEHWVEWAWVSVEEVLVVDEGVGVAVVQDALVGQALHRQTTQPRPAGKNAEFNTIWNHIKQVTISKQSGTHHQPKKRSPSPI